MLQIEKVSCGYPLPKRKYRTVLEEYSLTVHRGEIVCILGRNGIGKSTLFKTILGGIPLLSGQILVDGQPVKTMKKQMLAREIAYVPQSHTPPFAFTVKEIVLMGRNVYIRSFGSPSAKDEQIAGEMLERLHISHLAEKKYTQISGGEQQLVLIARAMAQQPHFMMMDEPTANLDYGNQVRILKELTALAWEGIGVLFTSHQPEQGFFCHTRVSAIKNKREFITGPADEVITEKLLYDLYGIPARIIKTKGEEGRVLRAITPVL